MESDLSTTNKTRRIGTLFSTPLLIQGGTWLPLAQILTWGLLDADLRRKQPGWKQGTRWWTAGLQMVVLLGSEWCHNLAHAAAAQSIGKPMDAMRILLGMPRVEYLELNDTQVTPRQHIFRALGGPLFNLSLVPIAYLLRRLTKIHTPARSVADAALGANLFLGTVSFIPIPGIDGGAILKWGLVGVGRTPPQADRIVQQVNLPFGAAMGLGAALAFKKRQRLAGIFLAMLAASALALGLGLIQEESVNQAINR